MTTLRLPGLVDVHTHMRDPGQTHKEDWSTGTAAALVGGFTTVLAMPNTNPPITDAASLDDAMAAAGRGARCDYGHFAAASDVNAGAVAGLAPRTVGLKMYLNTTFGELRLTDRNTWRRHLEAWPVDRPVAVHAEGATLGAVLPVAASLERPIHVCHLSREDEIILVREARDRGEAVTCEVTPHHLFLDHTDAARLGGLGEVRPPLASPTDREALWRHIEVIDCFATDHAPHTLAEKSVDPAPPGFPGLETALPLFLDAVDKGRLTFEDVVTRFHDNPRRIFGLPPQEAAVEVDPNADWTVDGSAQQTRAGWSPFHGRRVRGRVSRVTLRGVEVFRDGEVLAVPGSGRDVRARET